MSDTKTKKKKKRAPPPSSGTPSTTTAKTPTKKDSKDSKLDTPNGDAQVSPATVNTPPPAPPTGEGDDEDSVRSLSSPVFPGDEGRETPSPLPRASLSAADIASWASSQKSNAEIKGSPLNKHKQKHSQKDSINRLYSNSAKKEAQVMAQLARDMAGEVSTSTGRPQIISRQSRTDSKSIKPLAQRQKAMLEKKEEDIKKQQEIKKEEEAKECSFAPKRFSKAPTYLKRKTITTGPPKKVSVYVRVRPFTSSEKDSGSLNLEGLHLMSSSNDAKPAEVVVLNTAPPIAGFSGLIGQDATNRHVFERVFKSPQELVLRGGSANLFSYGYTGGGKTHTVIGYGKERGLFFLAAENLLKELKNDKLFLRATACEVYGDDVYDLLGEEKIKCQLRTNADGQLVISGPSSIQQMNGVAEGGAGEHATLVTKAAGLRSTEVRKPEDLKFINTTCVSKRATGISTEHDQSSRSHAILRLEVVSTEVLAATEEVESLEAEMPALQNALDNARVAAHDVSYEGSVRVLRSVTLRESIIEGKDDADLVVKSVTDDNKICLEGVEGGDEPKTAGEWAKQLDMDELAITDVQLPKEYAGGKDEREAKKTENSEKQDNLLKLVNDKQAEVDKAKAKLTAAVSAGSKALGGSMLLCDLAGADYDNRQENSQKESAAINKSLLTLKECFRSLAQATDQKPPFRESKLTRILQDSLDPTESSTRRNKESASVMLVNISPAASLKSGTINALRYGQMFAAATQQGRRQSVKGMDRRMSRLSIVRKADPEVIKTLREIYKDAGKTLKETNEILAKFEGREEMLLEKAKAKYWKTKKNMVKVTKSPPKGSKKKPAEGKKGEKGEKGEEGGEGEDVGRRGERKRRRR
ncbi:hypothetical protein TL16_g08932 [Triparma laevis f. inornata]|uniref:Kinesin motor domain-containing protein n=1 Tax=Triparma laevis f. inornata TaxID=1714386 RepID=A0A9W7B8C7_9STRA|nr:hypothetical protein TL16_g08932 [Triparma laevis f. inornata]